MTRTGNKGERRPLDRAALDRLALHYAARYATTRSKLRAYLIRKVRERGWAGEEEPPIEALVERFAESGYVDDRAFAIARTASLSRRGYGQRRVEQVLHASGISEQDAAEAHRSARENAWAAALRFAERRRMGPFAPGPIDRDAREKALAAMIRAGHPIDVARRIVSSPPGELPECIS